MIESRDKQTTTFREDCRQTRSNSVSSGLPVIRPQMTASTDGASQFSSTGFQETCRITSRCYTAESRFVFKTRSRYLLIELLINYLSDCPNYQAEYFLVARHPGAIVRRERLLAVESDHLFRFSISGDSFRWVAASRISKSAALKVLCSSYVLSPAHRRVCRFGQDSRWSSCGAGTLQTQVEFSTR